MRQILSALSVLLVFSLPGPVSAQDQKPPKPLKTQEDRVTLKGFRTQGGVVNLVEGEAAYVHYKGPARELRPQQELENDDEIQVGTNGRVEVLLNPGYYLRLFSDTRATFLDLSPNNLKLKISNGSAIVEMSVIEVWWPTFEDDHCHQIYYQPVTVVTPRGEFGTVSGGVYRFDVEAKGDTALKVTKGCAVVPGHLIESGMTATLGSGPATVGKFNRDDSDAFDSWSRERADALIRSNKSLKNTEWHKTLSKEPLSFFEIDYEEKHQRFKDAKIVSALGGFVTFVEKGVVYKSGDSEWTALTVGLDLKYGDSVRTGLESRAEIHVYPTCYLHLSSDAEIVYGARSDGGTAVRLLRGSAIITYNIADKNLAPVTLVAPQLEYEIAKRGVYRLNVAPGGESEMIVREGGIRVAGREVKEGKKAVFRDGGLAVTSIGKKEQDSFDVWSRKRPLFDYHRVENKGIWFFDQTLGAYTFVSGFFSFHSPYGGKYSVGFAGRGRR